MVRCAMRGKRVFLERTGPQGYPEATDYFSPGEAYPEYPFDHISSKPNAVYQAVRSVFQHMRLDAEHFGTPEWNPLGEFVEPGQTVVVKPDLMQHFEAVANIDCAVTHGSLIRAVLDYVYIATQGRSPVILGDAPLLGTDFGQAKAAAGWDQIQHFYGRRGIPLRTVDFRAVKNMSGRSGMLQVVEPVGKHEQCGHVEVVLDHLSLHHLADGQWRTPLPSKRSMRALGAPHGNGRHTYLIAKPVLEADFVINLPKLRTHCKAGMGGALENMVGINGHADFLPHDVARCTEQDADAYASLSMFRSILSKVLFRKEPGRSTQVRRHESLSSSGEDVIDGILGSNPYRDGGWYGNDSMWRTILDMNRVLLYAGSYGRMSKIARPRKYLTIMDAVQAGQGEAPLEPIPARVGYVLAGRNPVSVDMLASLVVGFDYLKIPSIRNAFALSSHPLVAFSAHQVKAILQGELAEFEDIPGLLIRPTSGWRGHIELTAPRGYDRLEYEI
mgnify:CR=1 FL=1